MLGVVDWELSTLGHPLADLAYFCQAYHVATPYQPKIEPGGPAYDFSSPVYDFSDGTERATGREFRLSEATKEKPVALIFGSYT